MNGASAMVDRAVAWRVLGGVAGRSPAVRAARLAAPDALATPKYQWAFLTLMIVKPNIGSV
jgi:hypothetical protein